ncbi:MAG: hypothetical protein A2218_07845 [Elusimicrobia bacterium RIFOXYA2_FULL_53_38]|nr:MAG: hypothetical protein A2218_07845 [Elusimicrobia bacterium RIFOXYA2_FULL_53_38]
MLEHEIIESFRAAMADEGIITTDSITPDEKRHRFHVEGDRSGSKNGWYIIHSHNNVVVTGFYGCWKRDIKRTWSASAPTTLTGTERELLLKQINAACLENESRLHEHARRKAQRILGSTIEASSEHPYLQRKGIHTCGSQLYKESLVIPLTDFDRQVHSLQFINQNGEKRFLGGGRTKGLFFPIGAWRLSEPIYITEGFATAASVHMATGGYVLAAISAVNLMPIARLVRDQYPEARIIICADNDVWTEQNPGLRKAEAAAETISANMAVPEFFDLDTKPTDFNDLAHLEGLDAVRQCLAKAILLKPRPKIAIKGGRLPEMVDEAERAIILSNDRWGIFQRGGMIVRLVSIPRPMTESGVLRPAGSPLIVSVTKTYLRDLLTRAAHWISTKEGEKPISQNCPKEVAESLLDRSGHWKLPPLLGIIGAPTLRPDGSVLNRPGYDDKTGLALLSDFAWPAINEAPTKADAEAALRILRDPFSEFPFVTDADRSAILAAVLTAIIRRVLKNAPLFAISSPTAGTGKGLLADIVSLIATGHNAPAMPQGGNGEEELRKRIISILLSGDLIVNIDNIEHPLSGDTLCSALTQENISDRLLGGNKTVKLSTTVLWLATGNNISFSGDMVRRGLMCRIDSGKEHPDQQEFSRDDLRGYVASKRTELVTAAITILKAFHTAGRPKQKLPSFGSFEDWSARVREPLVWLGLADPCLTRERLVEEDPIREGTQQVLETLRAVFDEEPFTLHEALDKVKNPELNTKLQQLREALVQVGSYKGGSIDAKRLGWWCRRSVDRPVGGIKLVRGLEKSHGVQTWRVISANTGGQEGQGGHFQLSTTLGDGKLKDVSYIRGDSNPHNPPVPPGARLIGADKTLSATQTLAPDSQSQPKAVEICSQPTEPDIYLMGGDL